MKLSDKRPRSKILEKFISSHFFKPDNELLATEVMPQIDLPIKEHWIKFGKNAINGWQIKADKPKGTIIFFHGSTGTNRSWKLLFYYLWQSGYSVLSFDYPGYGKSNDITTFSTFYYDIEKIFNYISNTTKSKINEFILFGHSLGCFAAQHIYLMFGEPAKIILQSPLFSLELLLNGKIPSFVLKYFKISKYSLENLYNSDIFCNILIGGQDSLLPEEYGIDLWKDREKTNLIVFPEYKHASFIKPDTELLDKIKF